jgi:hypothetical protein
MQLMHHIKTRSIMLIEKHGVNDYMKKHLKQYKINRTKPMMVLLVMVLGLLLMLPTKASANVMDFDDAIAIGEEINLIIRPNANESVVKQLDSGTRIGVYCEEEPGWFRVIYGNYRGYLKSENVLLPDVNSAFGNTLTDTALKSRPSFGSDSLEVVKTGYPVKIVGMLGDWYKVQTEPTGETILEGYIKRQVVMQTDADDFQIRLTYGMVGDSIVELHQKLFERGFYGYINYYRDENDIDGDGNVKEVIKINNIYDDYTAQSLKCFQYKAGLRITGEADNATLEKLFSDEDIHSFAQDKGVKDSVRVSRWWECVIHDFARGTNATIYDLDARKSYSIQRYSGTNHADVETRTSEDTAIYSSTFGGVRTWEGRAIWVMAGSTTYAASINGYPHAPENSGISGNGMSGQVCIHFKDSYGHNRNAEDPRHSKQVKSAYLASIDYYGMNKALKKQE